MTPIYFDYNATSPLHPEVLEKIRPFLAEAYGNPSSLHALGRQARAAAEGVRAAILRVLGDTRGRLVFTSGGTEADNLALQGAVRARRGQGDHLIVSAVEHSAVLHTAQALQREGFRLTVLPVDGQGRVDPGEVRLAITPRTILISVMHANNELGTLEPVEEIGRIARERGILFHTDAVQSFGKLPVEAQRLGADLLAISAHKMGGPKGTGALYVREGVKLEPILHGGPHERNLRAGTEGIAGIVGFGAAVEASLKEMGDGTLDRVRRLRDRLEKGLLENIPDVKLNSPTEGRVPGTLNVSFLGCDGETLLMALDLAGFCVSTGSACSAGSTEPSHVLTALGLPPDRIRGSIRFSLGWGTTEEEVEEALRRIPPVIERIRKVKHHVSD